MLRFWPFGYVYFRRFGRNTFSAKRDIFGQKFMFLRTFWWKFYEILGQNGHFWPKKLLSAQKSVSAEILVRPKFQRGTCFGFGVSAKILFCLSTRYERVLSKHFPEDEKRPSIEELEAGATAMLSMGHPLLLTGLRPAPPNFVYIGKAPKRSQGIKI